MKIRAIIFGSSGMIGQGVLMECLESPEVESILIINRSPGNVKHSKLKEIVHKDFSDFSSLSAEFAGYNSCFFCLGISAVGLSENEYYKTTFELTIRVAEALLKANKDFTFCYISGASTDSSENGKMMWARVKGKTENTLLAMPFKQVYMFRPGYIQPLKGIKSRTKLYNAIYFIFKPLYFILKPFKGMVTDTSSMGKSMIQTALHGYEKKILESSDINKVSKAE
ncbi:MAG TPA: NAD-dependent epimerase/dehydratase family protein [Cytophagaceae bacterium]|jgi:nucleoside-diphosphate-sugar epimerase|nr:NAD-dependent epimerase/dehydratase family protein [Cytophagaceae bacterium]